MPRRGKSEKGFSLIELVIVVSVLSILAAIVAPQVNKLVLKSKISRLESELKTIKTAVNTVYADLGVYPSEVGQNTDPGLLQNSRVPTTYRSNWEGPYLERWPTSHPWGGTYDYNYGRYSRYNFDSQRGNEVYVTIRNNFTRDILNKIDADLDDGNRNAGNIIHNGTSSLTFYVGEGPRW